MDRRLRSSQHRSSTSSLYVMDEEEGAMEIETRKLTAKRKLVKSDRSEEDSGDEEIVAPVKAKRNVREEEGARREMEKMERAIQVMKQKAAEEERRKRQKEEEKMQRKAVEEQRKVREEERAENDSNETDEMKIDKMLDGLQKIVVTIQKESGGKISINRADQALVLGEAFMIQREIVEIMKRLWKCEKKATEKIEKEERRERSE